jgi:hypothetical protein
MCHACTDNDCFDNSTAESGMATSLCGFFFLVPFLRVMTSLDETGFMLCATLFFFLPVFLQLHTTKSSNSVLTYQAFALEKL